MKRIGLHALACGLAVVTMLGLGGAIDALSRRAECGSSYDVLDVQYCPHVDVLTFGFMAAVALIAGYYCVACFRAATRRVQS